MGADDDDVTPGQFGNPAIDPQGPSSFRRWDLFHPDRNLEITVFPHGYAGFFPSKIQAIARRHGLVGSIGPGDERSARAILSVEPWNHLCTQMPEGYYPGATGDTIFGASTWEIKIGAIPALIELSYVNWRFYEATDFSTSIVAKIVPRYFRQATSANIAGVARELNSLMVDLQSWLETSPLDEKQILLRRYVDAGHQPPQEPPPEPEQPPPGLDQPPAGPGAVAAQAEDRPQTTVKVKVRFPINRRDPDQPPAGSGAAAAPAEDRPQETVKVKVQFPPKHLR
jgi:hypothetical protein